MEARAFLSGIGIDLSAEQQTKTATALEFFVNEARGDAAKANSKKSPPS